LLGETGSGMVRFGSFMPKLSDLRGRRRAAPADGSSPGCRNTVLAGTR